MKAHPFILLLVIQGLHGQTVTRGPYLQMATDTTMTIRWRTDTSHVGRVFYGTDLGNLNLMADGTISGTDHEIKLSGLSPSTKYYYGVAVQGTTVASGNSNQHFTTSPSSTNTGSTRIWTFGDSGTGTPDQFAVRNAFNIFSSSKPADLMLLLGDNAYPNGGDAEYQAYFFNVYSDILRRTPVWSTLGNHDTANSVNPNGAYPYFQIFTLPTAGEAGGAPSGKEHYYSFDRGDIHFICLDSMTMDRSPTGPMATWLQNDLSACTKTWIIAFWHHPTYSKGSHDSDTEPPLIQMRSNILPILEAGGVDLVLLGHSHTYERSKLIDGHYGVSTTLTPAMIKNGGNGRENEDGAYLKPLGTQRANHGAVHAVVGSAGSLGGGSLNHPVMSKSLNQLGSLVIDVNGNRLDAWFIQPAGSPAGSSFVIGDSFTILKQTHPDRDKDGLPDEYETSIGLDPDDPSDAALDRDDDGISNLEEYQVSPPAAGGVAHRVLIRRNAETAVTRLVFHATGGYNHRISSSEDLAEWNPASEWFTGNNKPLAWTDASMPAPVEGKRLFRVEITPVTP